MSVHICALHVEQYGSAFATQVFSDLEFARLGELPAREGRAGDWEASIMC
jgi:hypothetical protein